MTESNPPKSRLVPRNEYSAKRAKLTGERLRQVELAERGIAENPDHDDDRWPSDAGGRIDFSPSESGSMIEYKRDERPDHLNEVELIDLIDVAAAAKVRRWPVDSA